MELKNKHLLLFCIAVLPLTLAAQNGETAPADTIPKEYVTHRIVNDELRDLISEYDKMYAQYTDDPSMGIIVYCTVNDESITYSISHMADIGRQYGGLIVCEPINGKEVSILVRDLQKQIELPMRRSVELLKNSNQKEYESHKRMQKEIEDYYPRGTDYGVTITYDFVSWKIVFDKDTGKCLRKETPDWTKRLQREQKRDAKKSK